MTDVLQQAGFRGQSLALARAVVAAESRGNAQAHNTNAATGDNSYGLFQINMLGGMGPERRSRYGLKSNNDLFDPLTNAKVAYNLSKGGTDFTPWSTYKSGAYKSYLGKNVPVTGNLSPQGAQAPQQAPGEPRDPRSALLSMLQGQLSSYANTGQATSSPLAIQQALSEYQAANAPSTLPKAPSKVLAGIKPSRATMPGLTTEKGLAVIPGTTYQANAAIIPQVESISKMFGVQVNSGYRSPEHNKEVGGAAHSDHLSGNAIDFTGTQDQMKKLYQWAQGKFPYVEPWDQAKGNHVHISFIR